MLALLPVAMFLDAGALLEENGWRGFALPVLLRTRGPLVASLIVGLAWASWHFPVKYDAFLDYGLWGGLAYLGAFTIKIVAISVVITFFWARAGQATTLAIAMHGCRATTLPVLAGWLTGPPGSPPRSANSISPSRSSSWRSCWSPMPTGTAGVT